MKSKRFSTGPESCRCFDLGKCWWWYEGLTCLDIILLDFYRLKGISVLYRLAIYNDKQMYKVSSDTP